MVFYQLNSYSLVLYYTEQRRLIPVILYFWVHEFSKNKN